MDQGLAPQHQERLVSTPHAAPLAAGKDDSEDTQAAALPADGSNPLDGSPSLPLRKSSGSALDRVAVRLHQKHAVVAVVIVVGDDPCHHARQFVEGLGQFFREHRPWQ